MRWMVVSCLILVAACAGGGGEVSRADSTPLYPGETPELRRLITHYADLYEVPAPLIHRLIDRESDYRSDARAGPYYGLLQILPQTARTMGHDGPASELLDPDVNLRYGVRYLRGAYLLSGGDGDGAIRRYASGYYYEARDRCMLVETGLSDREIGRGCRSR
ncbi:lytic transglycosylase domain-containing protein [Rhodobacteraceae bacterium W635]|nr:lytic transglycosylase domain-containing protein [Rhodobacteraceae bacterium W635]